MHDRMQPAGTVCDGAGGPRNGEGQNLEGISEGGYDCDTD